MEDLHMYPCKVPFRAITSLVMHPTTGIQKLLHNLLHPRAHHEGIVEALRDSLDLLQKVTTWEPARTHGKCRVATIDVKDMFMSILPKKALQICVEEWSAWRTEQIDAGCPPHPITPEAFRELLQYSLDHVEAYYGHESFQQTQGIPMGSRSSVCIAHLYVGRLFKALRTNGLTDEVEFLGRFVDDVLTLYPQEKEGLGAELAKNGQSSA